MKTGTVIRCCPLDSPRTPCAQKNVSARHQWVVITGSTAMLPQYTHSPPFPPHAASPCANPNVRRLCLSAPTPSACAQAAADPLLVWITKPRRQQGTLHKATMTPGCPAAALRGARAPLTVALSQLLNLWNPMFLCPRTAS